jgi:hypothetical protein
MQNLVRGYVLVSNLERSAMLKGRLFGLVVHHLLDVPLNYGCSNYPYLGSHVGTSAIEVCKSC